MGVSATSAILLQFWRDGGRIEQRRFARALSRLTHRGLAQSLPVGSDWAQLSVFVLGSYSGCPASASIEHPIVIVDGWLVDPDTPRGSPGRGPTADPQEILRLAWMRSSGGAFQRVKGRYAAVILDPTARRVVAHRSPVAGPALYYHLGPRRLVIASEPWALLALDVPDELDPCWLSHYFHLRTPPGRRSPFAHVRELLPGEVLDCTADTWRIEWLPPALDATDKAIYLDDATCAERFRELLSRAVSRSTGGGPFGIMQSSGVDSSSLAAVVARDPALRGNLISTYSWSLRDFPDADEGRQIRELTGWLGLPSRMVPGESCWPPETPDAWPLCPNTPVSNPFRVLKGRLYERARQDGCTQLLNGNAGDLLYPGVERLLLEALRDGRPGLFLAEVLGITRRGGLRGLATSPGLRGLVRGVLNLRPGAGVPSHLTPFASAHLNPQCRWPPDVAQKGRPGQSESLLGLELARSVDGECYFINAQGLRWVEPYLDPDLVGFMLRIPAWQCHRQGMDKHVAREAMRGLLPEAIRTQPRVGLLGDIFRSGFHRARPWIMALLRAPGAEWPRYVRRSYVEDALGRSTLSDGEMMHLWCCAALEMWLNRYLR